LSIHYVPEREEHRNRSLDGSEKVSSRRSTVVSYVSEPERLQCRREEEGIMEKKCRQRDKATTSLTGQGRGSASRDAKIDS
jgi:hypothetical protein